MIESSDDLRAVIREHGDTDPDPASVAEKILASLTDTEAHVIARLALPNYTRLVLIRPRPAAAPAAFENADGQRVASRRQAATWDWVAAELACSVRGADGWTTLGRCDDDDLKALVASRDRKAAEIAAERDRYKRILTALRAAAVDLVEQLDRAVLAEILAR